MNKNYLKIIGLLSLLHLFLYNSHSDIFDDSMNEFFFINSHSTIIHAVDFNGDGFLDIFDHELIHINHYNELQMFNKRRAWVDIVFDNDKNTNNMKFAIVPPISVFNETNQFESVVTLDHNGLIKIFRYIDDPVLAIQDRYYITTFQIVPRDQENETLFDKVHHIELGYGTLGLHFSLNDNDVDRDHILIIASKGEQTKLFFVNDPFNYLSKSTEEIFPSATLDLPGVPSFFWVGNIDQDEYFDLDDIFFEYEGQWHIWLREPQKYQVNIPDDIVGVSNVIPGMNGYDLFMGVESETESDIAYIALQREQLSYNEASYQALPVSIPGKHLQGSQSHLFEYNNETTNESYPICIVYDNLDRDNPQPKTFYIYKIEPNEPTSPQLIQEYTPEVTSWTDDIMYFDQPELVRDFDNDGISDIVLKTMRSDLPHKSYFYGFMGIDSNTPISEWSLY